METDTDTDTVVPIEQEPYVGGICAGNSERRDAASFMVVTGTMDHNLRHPLQPADQFLEERIFPPADFLQSHLPYILYTGLETCYARKIQRPALISFRHGFRLLKALRTAARTSGLKGFQADTFPNIEKSGALRPKKPLVTRRSEEVDVHLFHIKGNMPGTLCGIDQITYTCRMGDLTDLLDRLYSSSDVGAMAQCDKARGRFQGIPDAGWINETFSISLDPGDVNTLSGHLLERPGKGVMLHGGGNHMVSRPEETSNRQVQRFGCAMGKDYAGGIGYTEKRRYGFTCFEDEAAGVDPSAVPAPTGADAHLTHGMFDRSIYLFRLWKGGRGIVQIQVHRGKLALCR